MRRDAWWLLGFLLAALLVGELPHALAAWRAPLGATGFGTAWFVDDFAQYEAAMRQGFNQPGWSDWLIHDAFTAEAHPGALMFPLYVGIGKLAAGLSVAPTTVEYVVEVLARAVLVLALWRFCRAFASGRTAARWAFGLALFASGFELFAALVGGYTGNWSYEMNGLGLLFAAPHVPLAMAATLELARELLRPRYGASPRSRQADSSTHASAPLLSRADSPQATHTSDASALRAETLQATPAPDAPSCPPSALGAAASLGWLHTLSSTSAWWPLKLALLSAAIALLQPFHLPVLLSAGVLAGLSFWLTRRGLTNLVGALIASVAALPVLLPTIATFGFQSFWDATYSAQNLLPSPAPHELLVDLGPTLVLALLGAYALRGRVAPFGLVLWLLLALVAMYLPVPYQRRLAFGIEPMVAVLAANSLVAACRRLTPGWAASARLVTLAVAASGTALVMVGVVDSGTANAPQPVYRSTTDLDAAATWLATQATPNDVIVADWGASNYLAPRTPARVYGGHPVATLHPDQKRFAIATVFAHQGSLAVARQLGAQWLVYGPGEAGLPSPPDPAFQSGAVKVYRVA